MFCKCQCIELSKCLALFKLDDNHPTFIVNIAIFRDLLIPSTIIYFLLSVKYNCISICPPCFAKEIKEIIATI